MNINKLHGLGLQGELCNLLFYKNEITGKIVAQYFTSQTKNVICEIEIKDFKSACSALLTYRHINGESIEDLNIMVDEFIDKPFLAIVE